MPRKKNNKSTAGKRNRKNRKTRKSSGNEMYVTGSQYSPILSECTRNYARVLTNPFGNFKKLPCVPDPLSVPSFKWKAQSRGVFTVGTGGVGMISMNPQNPSNQAPTGHFSTSTYSSTTWNVPDPGTASFLNDSPYDNTAAAAGKEHRLVGAGIKIRYTGTELNRGGRIILYRSPYNGATPVNSTSAFLLSYRTSNTAPSQRRSEFITYIPDTTALLDYNLGGLLIASPETLIIVVDGAVPGTSYEYETAQYFETIGSGITSLSASHSDPVGLGAVLSSIPEKVPNSPPPAAEAKLISRALNILMESVSTVAPTALRIVGGIAASAYQNMAMNNQNRVPQITYPQHEQVRVEDVD